ncbi:hypothetical protein [Sphingobium sp. MK2]|uniref:hypothetical protein n=1 Tax=Sphingobium sp. MK2 TaxID=3116540 RepID=UPI0032E35C70
MTVTALPKRPIYGNASDPIVGSFLAALDQHEAELVDPCGDLVLAEAALQGMLQVACDESPRTPAGKALALAVARYHVHALIEGFEDRTDKTIDVYDHVLLERLRVVLRNLWLGTDQPPEIAPIVAHLGIEN